MGLSSRAQSRTAYDTRPMSQSQSRVGANVPMSRAQSKLGIKPSQIGKGSKVGKGTKIGGITEEEVKQL